MTIPRSAATLCGVLAIVAAVVSFCWIGHNIVERSYEPHWQRWVAPVATAVCIVLGLMALMPTQQDGHRAAVFPSMIALVPGVCLAAILLGGPRLIVCGETADRVK